MLFRKSRLLSVGFIWLSNSPQFWFSAYRYLHLHSPVHRVILVHRTFVRSSIRANTTRQLPQFRISNDLIHPPREWNMNSALPTTAREISPMRKPHLAKP